MWQFFFIFQTDYLLTSNAAGTLSTYKGQTAIKHSIPIVSLEFVDKCIIAAEVIDHEPFIVGTSKAPDEFSTGKIVGKPNTCYICILKTAVYSIVIHHRNLNLYHIKW